MKVETTCLIILLISSFTTLAQNSLKLSGRVEDFETKELLGYVSVGLKGKSAGTVTNADGWFDFYLSTQNTQDTLLISMLGYSQFEAKVSEVLKSHEVVVRMKIRPTLLDEVVVSYSKLTALEIIKQAFSKIEENYPVQPYLIKAFFRETYEENNKTVFLIDAVVNIEDEGYKPIYKNRWILREKIQLLDSRASRRYFKSVFEIENFSYLTYSLKWRNIKYREPDVGRAFGPHPPLKGKQCREQYTLDDIVHLDNNTFYVVSYTHDTGNDNTKDIYYVDSETFAIKRHIIKDEPPQGSILNQWKWKSKEKKNYAYQNLKRDVTQEYEMYQGKMYLKYIKGEFLAGIYNEKTKTTEYFLKTNEMLMVTEIETANFEPIKNPVGSGQSLSTYANSYNSDFWNNYKQVKLFPLTRKQINDLEWETSLDEQFKNISVKK